MLYSTGDLVKIESFDSIPFHFRGAVGEITGFEVEIGKKQIWYEVTFIDSSTPQIEGRFACTRSADFTENEIKGKVNEDTDKQDPITPDHYHAGGIDLWTFAKANFSKEKLAGYHQISAMKYIMRAGQKEGNPFEQDIKKAEKHLKELLKVVEGEKDGE